MKTGIHPTTEAAVVTCATCGTEIETRWSAGDLTVDTCSQCHPVYTGRAARVHRREQDRALRAQARPRRIVTRGLSPGRTPGRHGCVRESDVE